MRKIVLLHFIFIALIGCDENEPALAEQRLKSVTSYIQNQQGEFRPGEKTEYSYSSSGLLKSSEQFQYDTQTNSYYHFSTDTYRYDKNILKLIVKDILDGTVHTTTRYDYINGNVSKITLEDNVTTIASIRTLGDTTEVIYQSSNGRSFTYKFLSNEENILYEKTVGDDLRLASESRHEYDSFKNPYHLLGYPDFLFRNYSVHNKVKSSSSYYSLAFPQLTPIAYEYEYNAQHYPIQQITTYQSTGSSPSTAKTKTIFEYTE